MDAGLMRERVRLERRGTTDDGYGNPVSGGFEAQFERAAAFIMSPGSETVRAARLEGQQPVTMILRYDSQTSTITTDWRAIDTRSGRVYAIKASADMDRKRQWWSLACVEGEAA